jgi:hypothetical protein
MNFHFFLVRHWGKQLWTFLEQRRKANKLLILQNRHPKNHNTEMIPTEDFIIQKKGVCPLSGSKFPSSFEANPTSFKWQKYIII